MNVVPTTDLETDGTSLRGHAAVAYQTLVDLFGEPNTEPSFDGKTDAEWYLATPDGVATIYNYKDGPSYGGGPVAKITDWHIGGYTDAVVPHVLRAIAEHPTADAFPAADEATMTIVLVDAAGDDVSDGDFVHVRGITIADVRDPATWEQIRQDLLEDAEAVEARDRGQS